jgi:hypothetical protein
MVARVAVRVATGCAAITAMVVFSAGHASAAVALQITTVGNGTVRFVGDPATNCPPLCRIVVLAAPDPAPFVPTLLAVPAVGWSFAGWTIPRDDIQAAITGPGGCSTSPTCGLFIFPGFAPNQDLPQPITGEVHVTATFVPTPPAARDSDKAFLCYSRFQVDPGVWPEAEAASLLAHGYWRPTAVLGGASATRLGPYSLVCNPPALARLIDHGFVDDGGVALADVGDPWLGLYPIAS